MKISKAAKSAKEMTAKALRKIAKTWAIWLGMTLLLSIFTLESNGIVIAQWGESFLYSVISVTLTLVLCMAVFFLITFFGSLIVNTKE